MKTERIWIVKEYDHEAAEKVAHQLGISPVTARLLVQRGIYHDAAARDFFLAGLEDLSDPFSLPGMIEAVDRIKTARDHSESVAVYGDYDVDGICSVVILKECLEVLGHQVSYYVPDRFSEGYGLNMAAVEKLAAEGYTLLITVDCGIKSVKEAARAKELGMDVIITDHHLPDEVLPEAFAIVNPRLGSFGKNSHLCGAGVAYQLARALGGAESSDYLKGWMELAALATVADIVPLLGDNRVLVKNGLKSLRTTSRIGLQALLQENNLLDKELAAWHIGFVVAPRLNSAGRLESAERSIELLLADDDNEARELARRLSQLNSERKAIEEFIYKETVLLVENEEDLEQAGVLVLDGDDWHHGVTGIVASRLCEKYHRPVILVSWEGATGKGSCRSIAGIDINAALTGCRDYLIAYGGHPLAAGLSLKREDYAAFKQAIQMQVQLQAGSGQMIPRQFIDMEIKEEDINERLMKELEEMEPFGEGNPSPVFLLRTAGLEDTSLIGKQQAHFKARLEENVEVIAFNQPQYMDLSPRSCFTDLVFSMQRNEFRGRSRLQLRVKDMRPSYRIGGTSGLSATLRGLLEKMNEALAMNYTVLCIFPTYRNLKSYRHFMSSCFRPRILRELHGHLLPAQRTQREQELMRGESRLFITTEAYLRFYLKRQALPGPHVRLVQVWPQAINGDDIAAKGSLEVELLPCLHPLQQLSRTDIECQPGKLSLVYANRSATVERLQHQWGEVALEAGVQDLVMRQSTRRQFLSWQEGVLLLDSMYTGTLTADNSVNDIIFADVPYSSLEAMTVLQQVKQHEKLRVLAAFNQADINYNRDYLNRLYPGLETVRSVWQYLKGWGKPEWQASTETICHDIAAVLHREFKEFDLLAVMQILSDLGLCHNKKKGSIMAIKLLPRQKATLDINSSPYYLEGQAEKAAYEMLVKEMDKVLLW